MKAILEAIAFTIIAITLWQCFKHFFNVLKHSWKTRELRKGCNGQHIEKEKYLLGIYKVLESVGIHITFGEMEHVKQTLLYYMDTEDMLNHLSDILRDKNMRYQTRVDKIVEDFIIDITYIEHMRLTHSCQSLRSYKAKVNKLD